MTSSNLSPWNQSTATLAFLRKVLSKAPLILAALLGGGCNMRPVQVTVKASQQKRVYHYCVAAGKEGRTLEMWECQPNYATGEAIKLALRLTADPIQGSPPEASVRVKLIHLKTGEESEKTTDLRFESRSSSASILAVTEEGQERQLSLQDGEGWEATIPDAGDHAGAAIGEFKALPPGKYRLELEARIQGGPTISLLNAVEITRTTKD